MKAHFTTLQKVQEKLRRAKAAKFRNPTNDNRKRVERCEMGLKSLLGRIHP